MTSSFSAVCLMTVAFLAAPRDGFAQAAAAPSRAAPSGRAVQLRFEATVGDEAFACGTRYDGIGVTRSSITVADLRFYVSALRLIRDDGADVPLALTVDDLWQQDDVVLLDFEDGTKSCANGTPETRTVVEGRVPDTRYTGVRFVMGVPFEKNHREPTLQPSPLNLTRMFWNWNGGYKFLRLDMKSTGQPQGWMLHVGSTGCAPHDSPTTVPISCGSPNEVSVTLSAFDVDRDVVRIDLRALLAESNVDANQADTPAGCMSGPADEDCAPVFRQLGLPFGSTPAGPQHLFSARRGTPSSARGDRP